jgi:hypothetical protein
MKILVTVNILILTLGGVIAGAASSSAAPAQWSITSSPTTTGERTLTGVSCVQSDMCIAAGRGGAGTTLYESWNGSSWTVMPSPQPPGRPIYLGGVSCGGPQFCVAVGYDFGSSGPTKTAIETWKGKKWRVTPSPDVADDQLYAVSCANPSFCVAVGTTALGLNDIVPLILSWDGSQWSVDPNPSHNGDLGGVSCTGPTNCIAAGWANTSTGGATDLFEDWDGTSWSLMPGAAGGNGTEVSAISCAGADSCMAVGATFVPAEPSSDIVTFAEYWNGSEWAITPTPNAVEYRNFLTGVSCFSDQDCVAVGYWNLQSSPAQTMIESWNGETWSLTPSPDRGRKWDSVLNAVSCSDQNDCIAVGSSDKNELRPLVETGTG